MSLKDAALGALLRPRVLHALPGRLRIHLPLLKRLPENDGIVSLVADLLSVPEGIAEVAPNTATGNVLLRYDGSRLSRDEVMGYLQSVTRICVSHRDRLESVPKERIPEVGERLRIWLGETVSARLHLDPDARVPDDVLA